ncbi:MAG TPA: hypothetical protein VL354_06310 [Spirochaetia bacterium]|nr:hypothetical protein [Spirochaetia bacterium]
MRERNEEATRAVYAHSRMRKRRSLEDLSVSEILRRHPEAAQALVELHTQCVGCPMAVFCTPWDVAEHYAFDLKGLLSLLRRPRASTVQ